MDISALFGSSSVWGDLIAARSQIPGAVAKNQTVASVKDTITNATRLSSDGKQNLNRLTDTVNQYAKGNTTLLRNIVGISNLMQLGAKEQTNTGSSPYAALLQSYYAGRTGSISDVQA